MYYDIESGEYLTRADLQREFEFLKASEETEADSFEDYLKNCLSKNGTLEKVRN